MGAVPTTIFTSSSGLPLYIPTRNKFEWTPYFDPTIQECIPLEFLVNPNIWHVKVPLVMVHGKPDLLGEEAKGRPQFCLWTSISNILHVDAIDISNDNDTDDNGKPYSQLPIPRSEDTWWKPRSNRSQSTMNEGEENKRPRTQLILEVEPRRIPIRNLRPP
ncbi:hypothetical protein J1N35_041496 [Gossypium stocksii]|uniref:Uncharacterized protein n=1 Tax=Gossypium stocksii TaxID=47602 RepID=A0A9D3UG38_9ROSI|nr:hypothetical protein J1N35_041496 [Gossypium stocksii]